MTEARKLFLLGLIALVSLAFVLRIYNLDSESLFMDEAHQIGSYDHGFVDIIEEASHQVQPPLDYWIGHLVVQCSRSVFAVRLPAALFGVASVCLLALLLARYCSWQISLLAGLLMTLSPFHMYFSQEARPYSIVIFFFLTVLWQLDNFIRDRDFRFRHLAGLLVCSTLFLYSSALSPLVVIVTLILVFAVYASISIIRNTLQSRDLRNRYLAVIGTFSVAICLYLPILVVLLEASRKYAPHASSLDPSSHLKYLKGFSLLPMWKAYVTQLEPLGVALLPFILLAVFFVIRQRREPGRFLPRLIAVTLPCAALLHLLIFSANTNSPFRPPYPTYILPMVLFLAAFSWQEGVSRLEAFKIPHLRILLSTGVVVMLSFVLVFLWAFESTLKKADVKRVQEYVAQSYRKGMVVVADGLTEFLEYRPAFLLEGIPNFRLETLMQADDTALLSREYGEPIFILFYYHNYFLTPYSKYPIVPVPGDRPPLQVDRLKENPILNCEEYVGFVVLRLKNPSGKFAEDSLEIIEAVISAFPDDDRVAELHLAAAKLMRALWRPRFQEHISAALKLIPAKRYRKLIVYLKAANPPMIEFHISGGQS